MGSCCILCRPFCVADRAVIFTVISIDHLIIIANKLVALLHHTLHFTYEQQSSLSFPSLFYSFCCHLSALSFDVCYYAIKINHPTLLFMTHYTRH